MAFISIVGINKSYGTHQALRDVSFEVPRGSVYGLLGPNGAGKTTLIRIINQILYPDSGQITLDGRPLCLEDVRRIGYLPEERGLYKKMRVSDQAIYLARLKGLSRRDAITALKAWFARFEIESWWNKKVEELSKGMAQKVQFIVTVLHKPPLLIFDEPFSGFDPINANLLKNEILRLRDEGATVLFSTHNMESVEQICDHITLINRSQNVLSGEINAVREQFSLPVYQLGFRGSAEKLNAALPPEWTAEVQPAEEDIQHARLSSSERNISINGLLTGLLEAVEIVDFRRQAATMNDIFIRVVEQTNQNAH